MQTLEDLRAILLRSNFLGATEDYPFGPGTMTAKVGGKIFAFVSVDAMPRRIALKCDPEVGDELRAAHPKTVTTAAYLHKRLWISITLHGMEGSGDTSLALPNDELRTLIQDSYDRVVASLTRAQRAALADPIS